MAKDELWSFGFNIQQADALEKSQCLTIKIKSAEILFKYYEKFGYYKSKISQKEINNTCNSSVEKHSISIFQNFIGLLSHSKQRNIPERILSFIYEFFTLILSRKDKTVINLLESSIQSIISNLLIFNNKMNLKDQSDFYEVIMLFFIFLGSKFSFNFSNFFWFQENKNPLN